MEKTEPLGRGIHIYASFYNCNCSKDLLVKSNYARSKLKKFIEEVNLTCVDDVFYSFSIDKENQYGYTGSIVLAESHMTIHTWPEEKLVDLDIFVCNRNTNNTNKAQDLFNKLKKLFEPADIESGSIVRGSKIPINAFIAGTK